MSKRTVKNALAERTDERDYWRRLAEERGQRIAQLEGEMERMRIHADVLTGGVLERYDRHIERLQHERDHARAQIAATRQYFQAIEGMVRRRAEFDKAVYQEEAALVAEGNEWRAFVPLLVDIADYAAGQAERDFRAGHEMIAALADLDNELQRVIFEILRQSEIRAVHAVGRRMLRLLWAVTGAPELLAADILSQWERGEVDPATVAMLCKVWTGAPQQATLLAALETARSCNSMITSQTPEAIARGLGMTRRTLDRHIKLVDQLRELAAAPARGGEQAAERVKKLFFEDRTEPGAL